MPRETTTRPPARNPLAGFFTPQAAGVEDLADAKVIDVALIDPNPHQPRRAFDQAALDELAASIRRHGVLQPLLVRPDKARYQLIAGERRWRAAQRADVTAVPCIVREIDDAEAEVLALLENVQRQDLDPVDEARAYQRLIDRLHLSQHALAVSLDLNHTYVRNRLLLIEDPRIEAAVRTGALGVTVAQEIARSTEEEQRAALLNRAEQGERLRVRDVKPPARVPDAPLGENNFQQAAADAAPTEIENNFHPAARAPWPAHVTRPSPLAKTTTTISLPRVTATHVTPSETVRPFRQMSRYLRRRRGCALRMCDRLSYSRLAMAVRTWTSYGPPCGPTWKPWAGRYGMAYLFAADSGDPTPAHVTLTTDHVTADDAGPLAEALHTAGVAVERHTFLPARDDEAHPWGVLLLAASGPPLPLAHLVAPATAPAGVAPALAAALGSGSRSAPATLQLKADGVFVSIRGRVLIDITTALDVLPAQLARLDTRREERRLVYAEGAWRIDP